MEYDDSEVEKALARKIGLVKPSAPSPPRTLTQVLNQMVGEVNGELESLRSDKEQSDKERKYHIETLQKIRESLLTIPPPVDLAPVLTQVNLVLDMVREIKAGLSIQTTNAELERDVLSRLKTKLMD